MSGLCWKKVLQVFESTCSWFYLQMKKPKVSSHTSEHAATVVLPWRNNDRVSHRSGGWVDMQLFPFSVTPHVGAEPYPWDTQSATDPFFWEVGVPECQVPWGGYLHVLPAHRGCRCWAVVLSPPSPLQRDCLVWSGQLSYSDCASPSLVLKGHNLRGSRWIWGSEFLSPSLFLKRSNLPVSKWFGIRVSLSYPMCWLD